MIPAKISPDFEIGVGSTSCNKRLWEVVIILESVKTLKKVSNPKVFNFSGGVRN